MIRRGSPERVTRSTALFMDSGPAELPAGDLISKPALLQRDPFSPSVHRRPMTAPTLVLSRCSRDGLPFPAHDLSQAPLLSTLYSEVREWTRLCVLGCAKYNPPSAPLNHHRHLSAYILNKAHTFKPCAKILGR